MDDGEAAAVALRAQADQEIAEARSEGEMVGTFYEALITKGVKPRDAASLTEMYLRHYLWPDDEDGPL